PVRCAAALALAYAAGPALDQPSAQALADMLAQQELSRVLDDWYSDKYCRAYGGLATFLERLRPEHALLAGRALERGLAEADDSWPPAPGASGGQTARPPR
ncbi:MAG TPA: hypothetical protein VGE07_26305, partial [Herpetosiphonaceae bacterium]